tara:strand:- start:406 stop:1032 length:627 start_codon:yes stop_codon:yes gene_type:complete
MYINNTKTTVTATETTYMIPCTESLEYAYLYSDRFYNLSWLKHSGHNPDDTDAKRVVYTNNLVKQQCQDAVELDTYITGRVKHTLTEVYMGPNLLLVPEDNFTIVPQHLFIQRWTPQTKTFDLVVINNTQSIVVSAVPKHDIAIIREWSKAEIYCGGADPLPVKSIVRALQHQTYTEVCEALGTDNESDKSDEEWVPDTDSESDSEDY